LAATKMELGRAVVRPTNVRSWNSSSVIADILVFLIAGTARLILKVGGDLPVADLLLLPLLPFLVLVKNYRLRRRRFAVIFVLLILWFFGQVATDVYRRTPQVDWMRADARILFIGLNLLGLAALLTGKPRRQLIFFVGYALGSFLQTVVDRGEVEDIWKFGYATGVTILVVLGSCYFYKRRRHGVVVLLLLAIAAVHGAFDYRSPILLLFLTLAFVTPIIPERIGRIPILPLSPGRRMILIAVLALAAGQTAIGAIEYFASHGYLGEKARKKNEIQSEAKGGLLIGGRPEILVSSRAAMDSPILGHGAWAKDMKYADMYEALLHENGLREETSEAVRETGLIPTHSHLMGAWVEAGILGPVFWIYIMTLMIRALARISIIRPLFAPFYAYMFLDFLWAIVFSPSGGRTILPECCLLIMTLDILDTLPEYVAYGNQVLPKSIRFAKS
jgi:hypothetical protein